MQVVLYNGHKTVLLLNLLGHPAIMAVRVVS